VRVADGPDRAQADAAWPPPPGLVCLSGPGMVRCLRYRENGDRLQFRGPGGPGRRVQELPEPRDRPAHAKWGSGAGRTISWMPG